MEIEELLDAIEDGVCVVDREGAIVTANAAMCRLTGLERSDLEGRGPGEVLGDLLAGGGSAFDRVLEGGPREEWEALLEVDGNARPCRIAVAPYLTRSGAPRGAVISARSTAAPARPAAPGRGPDRSDALGALAGGVAHDLNNVLSVIMSNAYFAERELGSGHPVQEDLDAIETAAKRALALTDRLLSIGRRQVLRPQVIELGDLLRDLEPDLLRTAGDGVEISIEPSPARCLASADRSRIEQVIRELVGNARDAVGGGGRITVSTKRLADGGEPGVAIEVRDTGPGVDPELTERIFDPFFSSHETKRKGLGLAVARGTAEQSSGSLELESGVGGGAVFRLRLPAVDEDD